MIIAIHGLHCSGKTRLIKEIISLNRLSFQYKKVNGIKFMISRRFKLIILGHYPEEGVYVGADQISFREVVKVCDLIKKLKRSSPDYSILIEGNNFNNEDFHNYLKRKPWLFKIFFLNTSLEKLIFRENMRMEPFSAEKRTKIIKKCSKLIENSNPDCLNNEDEQDLTNNVKIILEHLNIRTKTKVK